MRCSQPQGLTEAAEAFLKENALVKNCCEHCNRNDGYDNEVIGMTGMFDDVPLARYKLKDGYAEEFVQYCVWSSGPMEWFGLRVYKNGKQVQEFVWPPEVVEDAH